MVRDMLDANELSPRFDEDDEDEDDEDDDRSTDCELEDWLDGFDDYDTDAMRVDIANNNLTVGDDAAADRYKHENIIAESIINGNFSQAEEQCIKFGYDCDEMRRLHG